MRELRANRTRHVQVVGSNPGQSPNLRDGECRCQCAAERARPTTPEGAPRLHVRPSLPELPKLLRASCKEVDPEGHCCRYGALRFTSARTEAPERLDSGTSRARRPVSYTHLT